MIKFEIIIQTIISELNAAFSAKAVQGEEHQNLAVREVLPEEEGAAAECWLHSQCRLHHHPALGRPPLLQASQGSVTKALK